MDVVREIRPVGRVSADIGQVIGAWSALAEGGYDIVASAEGVTQEELAAYESATGGGYLAPDLRALYSISRGGFELIDLMMAIHEWPPEPATDYGIEPHPDFPEIDQVQVFGGDRGDNVWAFWLQRGEIHENPPALVLVDHSFAEMRSVGTVARFLRLETAMGLLFMDANEPVTAAMDALGLPAALRGGDPNNDSTAKALMAWAGLTEPYQEQHYLDWEPLSAEQVEGLSRDLR